MSRRCRGRGDSSGSSISQRREAAMRRVMAGGRVTACPRHGLAAGCRGRGRRRRHLDSRAECDEDQRQRCDADEETGKKGKNAVDG
jgi:hypothetical protein